MEGEKYDPVTGLSPEHAGEEVLVLRESDGRATMVPKSLRRLGVNGREALADVQLVAGKIDELHELLAGSIADAREVGVPWSGIAWATGMSIEGARRRWGAGSDA